MSALHLLRSAIAALVLAFVLPATSAKAEEGFDPIGAISKLCQLGEPACGPYDDVAKVILACFQNQNEIDCALAIAGVTGNTSIADAQNLKDLTLACIKSSDVNACIADINAKYPTPEGKEAAALVKLCTSIADVHTAIVCSDALLNSSFAAELGVTLPSWVGSLFDIYMDIVKKDYISLIYHVGATVACIVANVLTGFDVCGLFTAVAELAGAIIDGVEAVYEFLSDVFGGVETKNCYLGPSGCQPMFTFVYDWLHKYVGTQYMADKLAVGVPFDQLFNDAMNKVVPTPVWQSFGPPQPDIQKGWLLFMKDSGQAWDGVMKNTKIPERNALVAGWAAKITQAEVDAIFDASYPGTNLGNLGKKCLEHSPAENAAITFWMKEGGAKPHEITQRLRAHCNYRIALRVLPSHAKDVCTVITDDAKEKVTASCNTGRALDVCNKVANDFGSDRVACGYGKGGEKGNAQESLLDLAKLLGASGNYCTMGMLKGDPNALHCPDPVAVDACNKLMGEKYGDRGWPKAGVAECKLVPTPQRLKAVEDALKVAAAAPGVIAPQSGTGPSLKPVACGTHSLDAAVVFCQKVPTPANLAAIQAKLPGIKVTLCASEPKSGLHWVTEACISPKAHGNLGEPEPPKDPGKQPIATPAKPAGIGGLTTGGGPMGGGPTGGGLTSPGGGLGKSPGTTPGGLGGAAKPAPNPIDKKAPAKPAGLGTSLNQPGK